MKKFLICTLTVLSSLTSFAQHYHVRNTGYKAFANIELASEFADGNSSVDCYLATSHGYQFNPYFFLGGGFGIDVNHVVKTSFVSAPLFGQVRVNLTDSSISPYLDCKGGYSFGDLQGAYVQPSVGVSFAIKHRFAINVGLAYTCMFEKISGKDDTHKTNKLAIQFGFEF